MSAADVLAALKLWHIPVSRNEFALHASIAEILGLQGIEFEREVVLGPRDRIDFLCDGGVGIEAKTDGGVSDVIAQLYRYAQHECISGLILVTTRRSHRVEAAEMNGKPVLVHWICGMI